MTTSAAVNAALLGSLQRVREQQARANISPVLNTQNPAPYSVQNTERNPNSLQNAPRTTKEVDHPNSKPIRNSPNVPQQTKAPHTMFPHNNQSTDNNFSRPIMASTPASRSFNHTEVTAPVKVVRLPLDTAREPSEIIPSYVHYPQPTYRTTPRIVHTEPQILQLERPPNEKQLFNYYPQNTHPQARYYGETDELINSPETSVYRYCECCARGRCASSCPSCYFCELFYGCPLYCWLLTFLLLLLPMLALFGWLLSEQPAINPAKRQYATQQSSIVQNDVYDVMHNCAVPYCTVASPATTINSLYLTYHDYSVTQVTSMGHRIHACSLFLFGVIYSLIKLCEMLS